jgi:pimeloyl-ACP methyl ester carboxylesterase
MTIASQLRHVTVGGTGVAVGIVAPSHDPLATVVWLHGLGGASTVQFSPFASDPALADVTSVLIDLPGFGQSAGSPGGSIDDHAAIVREVIARMAEPPVILFGHSMGGTVAILAAHAAPDSIAKLVVAEPNLEPGSGPLSSHIAAMPERDWLDRGHRALVRTAGIAARRDPAASGFLATLEMASPLALHRAAISLVVPRSPSPGEMFDRLGMPRAAIVGETSDPGWQTPGAPTFVVRGTGHDMMAGNPAGFLAALTSAIGPLAPPRTC